MTGDTSYLGIAADRWGHDVQTVKHRLTQSSFVSRAHKYLYLEVPKAACTTLKQTIHRIEGLEPVQVTFDRLPETRLFMFIHDRERFGLPALNDIGQQEATDLLEGDEYFKFTFVRNPYSRLISAWKNKLYFIEPGLENLYVEIRDRFPQLMDGQYVSFEGFVRYLSGFQDVTACNPHYMLQTRLIFHGAIRYDLVGKIENFDTDIATVSDRTGVDFTPQRSAGSNVSDKEDWRSYYTQDLADLVYDKYRPDFDALGYERDSWRGGSPIAAKTPREMFLEQQIFDRNRTISQMYQWIAARKRSGN